MSIVIELADDLSIKELDKFINENKWAIKSSNVEKTLTRKEMEIIKNKLYGVDKNGIYTS